MSRITNAIKNVKYGYINSTATMIIRFIRRTIFILTIGTVYLGVNGLITNVLSIISFAELGIGTAMNFSLYKPVAHNDMNKIKSIMSLYRKVYQYVALIVLLLGLVITPLLPIIIGEIDGISQKEIIIYYLIYLFNMFCTYFISYKYSVVNAEQKNYVTTNINTLTLLASAIAQVAVLLLYHSFLLYLIIGAVIELIQKIAVNYWLNKKYPYLKDKNAEPLPLQEKKDIIKNVKALIIHKIGEVSVYQTDNILVSYFVSITIVGLISNYNLIIMAVSMFINIIFNSVTSGFGNLFAVENRERQFSLFKIYRFAGFWIFGFSFIAFYFLLSPFIELWIGKTMLIDDIVILFILIDFYFRGHRTIVNNIKTAAGIFDSDKYVAILQAITNLFFSIILVKLIGLSGIYLGTIIQGLVSTLIKPRIVYHLIFKEKVLGYYIDSIKYMATIGISMLLIFIINANIHFNYHIVRFICTMILVTIIPNIVFWICFHKREEYNYFVTLIKNRRMNHG